MIHWPHDTSYRPTKVDRQSKLYPFPAKVIFPWKPLRKCKVKIKRTFSLRTRFRLLTASYVISKVQVSRDMMKKILCDSSQKLSKPSTLTLRVSLVMTLVPNSARSSTMHNNSREMGERRAKTQRTANHVHDKISLGKIMMISSKFSFPLDAEHNESFCVRGWNQNKKE